MCTLLCGAGAATFEAGRVHNAVSNMQPKVDKLCADVSQLQTNVSQLQTNVSQLQTDVGHVRTDLSDLNSKMDLLLLSFSRRRRNENGEAR